MQSSSPRSRAARRVLVTVAVGLTWALTSACGLASLMVDDDDDDVSLSAAAAAPAEPPPPPPIPAPEIQNTDAGFNCRLPAGTVHPTTLMCQMTHSAEDRTLRFVGPVGTRFRTVGLDITLTDADRLPTAELASSPRPAGMEPPLAAARVVPISESDLFDDLTGVCGSSSTDDIAPQPLSVTFPDRDEPISGTWDMTWMRYRNYIRLTLLAALEGDAQLPERTGSAIIYARDCHGGEVTSLADIRFVATRSSEWRSRGCGRYQAPSGSTITVNRRIERVEVELHDVRERQRVARRTFSARTPRCPRTVRGNRTVRGRVRSSDIGEWVERQVERRAR